MHQIWCILARRAKSISWRVKVNVSKKMKAFHKRRIKKTCKVELTSLLFLRTKLQLPIQFHLSEVIDNIYSVKKSRKTNCSPVPEAPVIAIVCPSRRWESSESKRGGPQQPILCFYFRLFEAFVCVTKKSMNDAFLLCVLWINREIIKLGSRDRSCLRTNLCNLDIKALHEPQNKHFCLTAYHSAFSVRESDIVLPSAISDYQNQIFSF